MAARKKSAAAKVKEELEDVEKALEELEEQLAEQQAQAPRIVIYFKPIMNFKDGRIRDVNNKVVQLRTGTVYKSSPQMFMRLKKSGADLEVKNNVGILSYEEIHDS